MATMERTSRIVRCPKCLALLQEPPLGTPLYKCGNCSTVLRAKHASSDGSGARRASTRPQQMNRSSPPIHTDSIESRKLPSKPVPLDPTSRQVNLDDPDEYRNRSGISRLKAADTGNNSPSSLHRNTCPSGPPPPTYLPRTTNTYADNGSRAEQRLAPRDLSASPSDREKEKEPSPVQWRLEPIVKVKDATMESASAGYKPLESVRSTESASAGYKPVETLRSTESASAGYKPLETVRTTESAAAGYKPMETVRRTESATAGFKPLETLRSTESTSVGYKLLETVRSTESGMAFYKPLETVRSTESATAGHKSLETGRSTESGIAVYKPLETVRRLPVPLSGGEAVSAAETNAGSQRGSLPTGADTISKSNTRYEVSVGGKAERAADSDGEDGGRPSSSRNSHPPEVSLRNEPSSNDKPLQDMLGSKVSEIEADDCDSLKIDEEAAKTGRARMNQVEEVRAMPDKADRYSEETLRFSNAKYLQQGLPPGGDVPLVRTRSPELKSLHKEQIVVSKDDDDEDQPGTLLDKREQTSLMSPPAKLDQFSLMSPPAIRKPLSPPRFLQSRSVIGVPKPQPDNVLKVPAGARQDSGASSNLQEFHGQPDVLDYDTSEDSSNVDDSEQYQITSKPHSEELRSPNHLHNGRMSEADAGDGISGRSVDEDEHEPTGSQDNTGVINSVGSVKAGPSPFRSPESNHSESPPETQTSNQRKHEVQGRQPPAMESTNSFAFGRGGQVEGPPYSSLKGQTQKIRLQINTPVPDRIHVRCKHCNLQLEVPSNLGRSETGVQKLRCGSCWKISRFRLNHLLDPSGTSSPAGSDRSPETSFRLGSSDGQSSRYSGTRSNRETGTQDRVVIRTQSGANLPVPPSARHNPRAASGSKLSNMVSGSNIPSETSKTSTPNTSGDLGPAGSSPHGGKEMMVAISPTGQAEPSHTSLSPTLSSTSQDVSSKDHRRKTTASPDRKLLQSSSDSEEEKNTIQLKLGPSSLSNPTRTIAWANPTTPEFDDGHEFKGLKGFLKKSVKELTKGKKSTQYRRKVVVNGQPVPDDVVRRAEDYAGGIHPGSYWYDYRAGFWGVMGGPCLGMIPPFIEELNFPLARHCSHGKTGVLVNGRELHHKDLELLKKRGLPGTPGKAYNVDIDGRLTEETTGAELKGLGRLAPTLEQTGRGPGMWVPENQRGS